MLWYWIFGLNKYKGKSLFDYVGIGFICVFFEIVKKKLGDLK